MANFKEQQAWGLGQPATGWHDEIEGKHAEGAVLTYMVLCPMTGPQGLALGPDDGLLYVTVRSFSVSK